MAFLGIDAGTTAMKAAVFDECGHLLGRCSKEYELLTPPNGWIELVPEVYWQSCCVAVRGAVADAGIAPQAISALAISSQAETLIPVDDQGEPTRNAIVWLDNRAVEEARLFGEILDIEDVYRRSGQPEITPTWPACKLLWMRRHEPEAFARSKHFLLVEDYLLHRMTGQFVTEYSLQTSSMMLDIVRKRWWSEVLEYLEIGPERLGRLVEPGGLVGRLSSSAAVVIGLTEEAVVVAGAIDQAMGALGAGNHRPGVVTETTGGALAVVATLDGPRFDTGRRLPCHYHACPDTYCLLAWGQTAGMVLRWARDQLFSHELLGSQGQGDGTYDLMTRLAAEVAPGADGVVMLPHLEGAACPEFEPGARGVFYGLALRHTRAHLVRAVLESVAYMLRKNLSIMQATGLEVKEIRSLGGGARSDLWLQIKADVLQIPVRRVNVAEAACLGAAMLCAVATGVYSNLDEATEQMVRLGEEFEPQEVNAAAYCRRYQEYVALYDQLAPLFRERRGIS